MPATTLVKDFAAKQSVKPTNTTEAKEQLLAKELFSPQLTHLLF